MSRILRRMGRGRWALLAVVVAMIGLVARATLGEERGFDDVVADLSSSDVSERAQAVADLVQGGSQSLSKLLGEIDSNDDPTAKGGLAEAVWKIGVGSNQEAALTSLLAARNPATRHAAIAILARHTGVARAALARTAASATENSFIRAGAAEAMGGDSSARSALKSLIANKVTPSSVRVAAIRGLARTGTNGANDIRDVALDGKRTHAERRSAVLALGQAGADSHDALVALVQAGEAFVRAGALAGLAFKGSSEDFEALAGWCGDDAPEVRVEALRTLVILGGGADHRSTVAGLLSDSDVRVQILAVRFFAKDTADLSETTQAALQSALESDSAGLRYEAALALHAHGDDSGKDVMKADRDRSGADEGHKRRAALAYATIINGNG
jgi:HEAT repeat protein